MLQSVEEGMALILGAVCGTDIITGRETHFIWCKIWVTWTFVCHRTKIELCLFGTLTFGHTPRSISSPWGEYTWKLH